jgi:crossover junction endodeoxyribonuclease RuvC
MSGPSIRILGIDPGLQVSGFGVIDAQGPHLHYVASGTIRTRAEEGLPARLKVLFDGVRAVTEQYSPAVACIEIVFINHNPQASLLLGQARGSCLTALVSKDLPVHEYTALQLKKAVAGHGRAGKPEVQQMVMRMLKLPGLPGPDAADALALAITHAQVGGTLSTLARAAQGHEGVASVGYNRSRYRQGRTR